MRYRRPPPEAALERPTVAEIEAAAALLRDVVVSAPAVPLHEADDLWIKPEIHQPTGSFKIRGVYHAVARMTDEARARGLSTVSAGNTAKALAWAGRRFGVEARSRMPAHAPREKVEAVRALGGTPVLVSVEEVFRFLKEAGWEQEPYAFVHPWTEREVVLGHATLGAEIVAEVPALETVFVPVGGGGLLAGVGSALRALAPGVRIVAVEPAGCPAFHAALEAGGPVEVPCDTLCDGVAVPYTTEEMFPLLRDLVDDAVLVDEGDVRAAIRHLVRHAHVVAEGAGALAVAAALATPRAARGRSACPITGGSIDPGKLAEILVESGTS